MMERFLNGIEGCGADSGEPSMQREIPSHWHNQDNRYVLMDVFRDLYPTNTPDELLGSDPDGLPDEDEEPDSFLAILNQINRDRKLVVRTKAALMELLDASKDAVAGPAAVEAQRDFVNQGSCDPSAVRTDGWHSVIDVVDCEKYKEHGLLSPDMYLPPPQKVYEMPKKNSEPAFTAHTDSSYNRLLETAARFPEIEGPPVMSLAGNFATAATALKRRESSATSTRSTTTKLAEQPLKKTPVFVVSPSEVLFDEYVVGQPTERLITLTNISKTSRHVNVHPPSNAVFFLERLGQPKTNGARESCENGGIAPGLSCKYQIRFVPKSLADITDKLVVTAEEQEPIQVSIVGRRPIPVLGFSKELQCGNHRLNSTITQHFSGRNSGAPGRFRLMKIEDAPKENEIATLDDSFWTADHSTLSVGQFVVSPCAFNLSSEDEARLQVDLNTSERGRFCQEIVVVKDNCTLDSIILSGSVEALDISIVGISASQSSISEVGSFPQIADVECDPVFPAGSATHEITISNNTFLEVPYSWSLSVTDDDTDDAQFTISPSSGSFAGHSTQVFTFKYLAKQPQLSSAVAVLSIEASESFTEQSSKDLEEHDNASAQKQVAIVVAQVNLSVECKPHSFDILPPLLDFPGELEQGRAHSREVQLQNNSSAPIRYRWADNHSDSAVETGIVTVTPRSGTIAGGSAQRFAVTVDPKCCGNLARNLECHLVGGQVATLPITAKISALHVDLDVPSINFGVLATGESISTMISVRNFSGVEAAWKLGFESTSSEEFLSIHPTNGVLTAFGETEVQVTFHPNAPIKFTDRVVCTATDGTQWHTEIMGSAERPAACLESCHINLDNVYVGVSTYATVGLRNLTNLQLPYVTEFHETSDVMVSFNTPRGELHPAGVCDLGVMFTAFAKGPSRAVVHILVEGMNEPLCLEITAQAQGLAVDYQFILPRASSKTLRLQPATSAQTDSSSVESVDFGKIKTYTPSEKHIVTITNQSGVAAKYSFHVLGFPSLHSESDSMNLQGANHTGAVLPSFLKKPTRGKRGPAPPTSRRTGTSAASTNRRASTSRSAPQRTGIKTAAASEATRHVAEQNLYRQAIQMLQNRKGMVFQVTPEEAELPPNGTISVQICCCGDTWGKYTDILRCVTDELPPKDIPLYAEICGSPLIAQAAVGASQPLILRLPSVAASSSGNTDVSDALASSAISVRNFSVQNPTPFDLRIRWSCFHCVELPGNYVDLLCEPRTDDSVSIRIRPHEGVPCTAPFDMASDSEVIIRGKTSTAIQQMGLAVRFHNSDSGEFDGFVRGEVEFANLAQVERVLNLSEEATAAGVCVDRTRDRIELTSLKVCLKGSVVVPQLVPLYGETSLNFDGSLADTMDEGTVLTKTITFSNPTEAQLCCQFAVDSPFFLQSVKVDKTCEPECVTIPPGVSALITVGFKSSSEFQQQNAGTPSTEVNSHIVKGALYRRFVDGSTHTTMLLAEIFLPHISASAESIDFGTVREGEQRFTIRNDGRSAAPWSIFMNDSVSPFSVSKNTGTLEGFTTRVSNIVDEVAVRFLPTKPGEYVSSLTIRDDLTKREIAIKLTGAGTFDGAYSDR